MNSMPCITSSTIGRAVTGTNSSDANATASNLRKHTDGVTTTQLSQGMDEASQGSNAINNAVENRRSDSSCTQNNQPVSEDFDIKRWMAADQLMADWVGQVSEEDAHSIVNSLPRQEYVEMYVTLASQQLLASVPDQSVQKNTTESACPICLDTVQVGLGIKLRACGHSLCEECIKTQLRTVYNDGKGLGAAFSCPLPNCREPLDHCELRQLLGGEAFDKLAERSLDTAVQSCQDL
jgi:hypothetical protein